jgi:putative transposase
MLAVQNLIGIPVLPKTPFGLRKWLKANGIPLTEEGKRFVFPLTALPEEVQLAYRLRCAEEAGIAYGVQDDEAHLALAAKPITVQAAAQERFRILMIYAKHRAAGLNWGQIEPLIKAAGFEEVPCYETVRRWERLVEGVEPANWAPRLAPAFTGRTAKAPLSEAAWTFFENRIETTGRNGTGANFKGIWKETKAKAAEMGWAWPCYRTVLRRWQAMPAARQRAKKLGAEAAAKSLTLFPKRLVEGMFAMEQVEQDFREYGVRCVWEDGYIGCPWVGKAVDRASSKWVGLTIAKSESEEAVVALNVNMVTNHGIPDRVIIDNGSAFNGLRMMGGQTPLIRSKDKGQKNELWPLPGVYTLLGIEVTNHGPRQAWAKLAESINSAMRHLDNASVFHKAQRAGPNDAPNPDPVPVPIALFTATLERAMASFNADTDNRAMGLRDGESRNAGFQRLSAEREARWPTSLHIRQLSCKWHLAKISEEGQVTVKGNTWGDLSTQKRLLEFEGQKVAVGIDPTNPHAPALLYTWDAEAKKGQLIEKDVPAFLPNFHNDDASKQRAKSLKRKAKAIVSAHVGTDLDAFVEDRRAEVMAWAEENGGGGVSSPVVQQIPKASPFKSGKARGARAEEAEAIEAKRLEQQNYVATYRREKREASGGNR